MSLVVEDGTGKANSNSYISVNDLNNYAAERAITLASDDDQDAACIRASATLDLMYRMAYPGYRTVGRNQAMEWPRTAAYDYEGIIISTGVVPKEIQQATCELAIRELAEPGSTAPDLDRGGQIQSFRAGSVAVTYGAGATAQTVFSVVEGIMASLIGTASPFAFSAKAVRG